jgi:hypothetical protein
MAKQQPLVVTLDNVLEMQENNKLRAGMQFADLAGTTPAGYLHGILLTRDYLRLTFLSRSSSNGDGVIKLTPYLITESEIKAQAPYTYNPRTEDFQTYDAKLKQYEQN